MRHVEKAETQAAQTMERTFAQKIHCLVVRALRSKGFFSILFPIPHFVIYNKKSGKRPELHIALLSKGERCIVV